MKILLIDNKTRFMKQVKKALGGHDAKVIPYNSVNAKKAKNFDVVILSGGYKICVKNHEKEYSKELEIIRNSKKPIFGICLGFELICYALGEKLKALKIKEKGIINVNKIQNDRIFYELPKTFKVYEDHRWRIRETKKLTPLAKSKDGIEIVKHPSRNIYGVQFHPEMFIKKSEGYKIMDNFLKLVNDDKKETPERYFFKYAFPCAFLPFKRGEITERGYNKLKREFCRGGSPSKKELEKTFPFAFKMIKRLAKRMKRNYWDIDVIKEYWVREHNRIIDAKESYFKSKSDRFRDLCRINKAGVISKRRDILIVKYGNKKRKVYSTIVPYIKRGDIVTIHFSYAIEKVR